MPMLTTILFFSLLLLGAGVIFLCICLGKYSVLRRQRQEASFLPVDLLPAETRPTTPSGILILAFSTPSCRQCRLLQTPVLQRVKEAHKDDISVIELQASTCPELIERFHVGTFPSTALFDGSYRLHAINYGFANAQCLLKQVEEVLG